VISFEAVPLVSLGIGEAIVATSNPAQINTISEVRSPLASIKRLQVISRFQNIDCGGKIPIARLLIIAGAEVTYSKVAIVPNVG